MWCVYYVMLSQSDGRDSRCDVSNATVAAALVYLAAAAAAVFGLQYLVNLSEFEICTCIVT